MRAKPLSHETCTGRYSIDYQFIARGHFDLKHGDFKMQSVVSRSVQIAHYLTELPANSESSRPPSVASHLPFLDEHGSHHREMAHVSIDRHGQARNGKLPPGRCSVSHTRTRRC